MAGTTTITFAAAPGDGILADDQNQRTCQIEDLSGAARVMESSGFLAPAVGNFPLGNIAGKFVFSVKNTFASLTDMMAFWRAQYALIGLQDILTVTRDTENWVMRDALLESITRVPRPESDGVLLTLRYTFRITTIEDTTT